MGQAPWHVNVLEKPEGVSGLKSKYPYFWEMAKQNGTHSLHLWDVFVFSPL